MLQQRVIKQKAYKLILEGIDYSINYMNNEVSPFSQGVRKEIQKVIEEEKEKIQNKLNKITLRPKNEISNGSSIS